MDLLVCQKGAFLKGVSLCWSVHVEDPSLLPQPSQWVFSYPVSVLSGLILQFSCIL